MVEDRVQPRPADVSHGGTLPGVRAIERWSSCFHSDHHPGCLERRQIWCRSTGFSDAAL